MSLTWTPQPHQVKGVQFALEHPAAGLFLDPGLGKTTIMLSAFKILKAAGRAKRMLVVAPKRVCELAWPGEVRKWSNFEELQMCFLHGKRMSNRIPARDIYLINPEGLEWYFNSGAHAALKPEVLVVDESTKFKNTNTARFEHIKNSLNTFQRRYILTGTPTPRGVANLFGQIYLLDGGAALGEYITHFRNKYLMSAGQYGGAKYKLVPQPGAFEAILNAIAPFTLRMEAADWITMPELVNNYIEVDLPPEARRVYDEIENNLITILEDETVLTVINAMAAATKCRQIANGGVYLNTGDTAHLHTAKLDALKELVEELNGKPLLCLYEFIPDAESISEEIPGAVWLKSGTSEKVAKEVIRAFNEGSIAVLLAHPGSAGHGLNLQDVSNHVCFYGLTWDLELYQQALARVWRSGNPNSHVTIHHIVARNTIDEVMVQALAVKDRDQVNVLAYLKEYTRRNHG